MRTKKYGDTLWTTIESPDFIGYKSVHDMIIDKDGNFVMVGWQSANAITYFNKLSPQGDFLAATIHGAQFGYGPGYGVVQTLDNGFFIASMYRDYNKGDLVALKKVDNSGNNEWQTNFFEGRSSAIKKKSDLEYYMTGYKDYEKGSAVISDIFLMKLDVNGDSVWSKIYKKDGSNEFANDLLILPDNSGILICGTVPSIANASYTRGYLLKTDMDGNVLWEKYYYRGTGNTSFLKMRMNPKGDVVVLASTSYGSSDLTLLKYNSNDDQLQIKHFDFLKNEYYGALAINEKGEIFVTGSTDVCSLLKITDSCPLDSVKAHLVNPDPKVGETVMVTIENTMNGNWYKLLRTTTNEVLDSAKGNGSTLYLSGGSVTESTSEFSNGYYVQLTDPQYNCESLSDTMYVFIPFPSLHHAIVSSGGKAIGTGGSVTYSFGQLSNKKSSGTSGTATDGIQIPYDFGIISGFNISDITLDAKIYPNPTTTSLVLQVDISNYQQPVYRLYDLTGKCLDFEYVTSTETLISMHELQPSTYILKIYNGSKELKTFKIIKTN